MFMCLTNTGDLLAELFITSYTKFIRFFSKKLCKNKLKMPYSSTMFHENKQEMVYVYFHITLKLLSRIKLYFFILQVKWVWTWIWQSKWSSCAYSCHNWRFDSIHTSRSGYIFHNRGLECVGWSLFLFYYVHHNWVFIYFICLCLCLKPWRLKIQFALFSFRFGDFVPGKNTLETEKKGVAALCTLYLLVGKSVSI